MEKLDIKAALGVGDLGLLTIQYGLYKANALSELALLFCIFR